MSNSLKASSRWLREQGDLKEAASLSVLMIRFGSMVRNDPQSLIEGLVGHAQLQLGINELRTLAQHPSISVQELQLLSVVLAELPASGKGTEQMLKKEFKLINNLIRTFATKEMTFGDLSMYDPEEPEGFWVERKVPSYLFQRNRTLDYFARYFRLALDNKDGLYMDLEESDFETLFLRGTGIRRMLKSNSIGELLIMILLPSLDTILVKQIKLESEIRATQLVVGLRSYQIAKGSYPESLEALVPDFLDAVPIDPFDGKPFRYDPEQKIIYVIGENGSDDGGSTVLLRGDESDSDDRKRWNAEDAVFSFE
jgi:hypothetical protein